MKIQPVRALLFFLLMVVPSALAAQLPVKAWLSKDSLLIGEPAQLAIEFTLPPDAEPDWYAVPLFPLDELGLKPVKDSADVLEVILKDGWTKEQVQGTLLFRCIFTVTGFEPGQFYLRDIPLGQNKGVLLKAPPVAIRVTAPPAKELAEIKDIIGDAPVISWLRMIGILLGIIVAVLLCYLIFRYYQKRKIQPALQEPPAVTTPPLSAYHQALNALKALEESKYLENGQHKEYYSRLSYILREYMEHKWNVPALESTTGDLHLLLKGKVSNKDLDQLLSILNAADLVKFAKSIPTDAQSKNWLLQSRQLLEQLHQQ